MFQFFFSGSNSGRFQRALQLQGCEKEVVVVSVSCLMVYSRRSGLVEPVLRRKGYDLGSSGEGEEEREAGNSVVKEPGVMSVDSIAVYLVA